jgi:hypothetical protein
VCIVEAGQNEFAASIDDARLPASPRADFFFGAASACALGLAGSTVQTLA